MGRWWLLAGVPDVAVAVELARGVPLLQRRRPGQLVPVAGLVLEVFRALPTSADTASAAVAVASFLLRLRQEEFSVV